MRRTENRELVGRRMSLPARATQTMIQALQTGRWTGDLPWGRKLCEILQVSQVTLRPVLQEFVRLGFHESVDVVSP